jgi:hypothetical protein
MSTSTDRFLPNRRARCLLSAIQDVIGRNGLNASLRLAGLTRYLNALPPNDGGSELSAAEYASLIQAIETQYGNGARGQLNRVGHVSFNYLLAAEPFAWRWIALTNQLLPPRQRLRRALSQLARQLAEPGGSITVHSEDGRLIFSDHVSDNTSGRMATAASEICWGTVGQLQACCVWATGEEYEVVEVTCRGKGDPHCNFEIAEL